MRIKQLKLRIQLLRILECSTLLNSSRALASQTGTSLKGEQTRAHEMTLDSWCNVLIDATLKVVVPTAP